MRRVILCYIRRPLGKRVLHVFQPWRRHGSNSKLFTIKVSVFRYFHPFCPFYNGQFWHLTVHGVPHNVCQFILSQLGRRYPYGRGAKGRASSGLHRQFVIGLLYEGVLTLVGARSSFNSVLLGVPNVSSSSIVLGRRALHFKVVLGKGLEEVQVSRKVWNSYLLRLRGLYSPTPFRHHPNVTYVGNVLGGLPSVNVQVSMGLHAYGNQCSVFLVRACFTLFRDYSSFGGVT